MPTRIEFFYEEVDYRILNPVKSVHWVESVIRQEGIQLQHINFILCSDEYLLSKNKKYLQHDYYTDIVTFNQSDDPKLIEADIYISIDRVKENATTNKQPFEKELHRVLIHGVLHLMGYNDKSPEQKSLMREKEDTCLSLHES